MTLVYLDCFSGISGDMLLGALLDAGVPESQVRTSLDALGLSGWELTVTETSRAGIRARRAEVAIASDSGARTYADIVSMLRASPLDAPVRTQALAVFEVLGKAEARVHGVGLADVHFHELGGLDAIVDIVGCCAALDYLAPESVTCSPIASGTGTVDTAHGLMPLPSPAVSEILTGVPLIWRGSHELVTPTGAALVKVWASSFGEPPPMTPVASGYGAGARDVTVANVVRVLLGTPDESGGKRDAPAERAVEVLATNIDDLSPELVPHVIDSLLVAGAQDAWVTPIVMKKGRPAFTLSVLADPVLRPTLLDVLYRETTTFGIRIVAADKDVLQRSIAEAEVQGHTVRVKLGLRAGEVVTMAPEYEDARKVAALTGLPLKEVYERAVTACNARRGPD